jgi:hypothetical protein
MDIIQLFSAAGIGGIIGSLLTTVVQSWLSHKSHLTNRNFQEKKEAYINLLDAMYKSETEPNGTTALYCGLCVNKCELVASKEVVELLYKYRETNPINGAVHPDRPSVMRALKDAMRKDLSVDLTGG